MEKFLNYRPIAISLQTNRLQKQQCLRVKQMLLAEKIILGLENTSFEKIEKRKKKIDLIIEKLKSHSKCKF
jgi:hypothetical protein